MEWLPTLCSFQLASCTAVARPCSQARSWLFRWILMDADTVQLCSRLQSSVGPRCAEIEVFPGRGRIEDRCSKDREEHESSNSLCVENGGVDSMPQGLGH
eukprot:1156437-Pelagomonas_calceolata.AAC.1